MYGSTTVYAEPGKLETVTLKFNQMGDAPKKLREIQGGMSMGIPTIHFAHRYYYLGNVMIIKNGKT